MQQIQWFHEYKYVGFLSSICNVIKCNKCRLMHLIKQWEKKRDLLLNR